MHKKDFSVVVPVYNSAGTLDELFQRTRSTFSRLGFSFQMIFVDDYSIDDSWRIIKGIKAGHPEQVIGVKLTKNFGQHSALSCGIALSNAQFVITIDDDLQIPPEEIEKLILEQRASDADVVYGVFEKKEHSFIRNLGSRILANIIRYYAYSPGKGSSFKLIKSDIAQKITALNLSNVYIDEILGWYTNEIIFVPVKHLPRREGKSNYSALRLALMMLNVVINYTALPLRLMTYGGLLFSFIFFILGIFYIYDKIAYDVQLGFTSLIVATFFAASIILLSLGIIGEYIRRLYTNYHSKPSYSIKQILE